MLDALRMYLQDATSPEMLDELVQAHDVFDRLGMDSIDAGFNELLMLDDETDPGNTLTSIVNLTRELLIKVLGLHGVQVVDDVRMNVLTDLVNALLEIPEREDQHEFLAIATAPGLAVEQLALMVSRCTTHSPEDIMVSLDFVSQGLIKKIVENAEESQLVDIDEDDRAFRAERLLKYRAFVDQHFLQGTAVQELIAQGVDAGYPFEMYVNMLGRDMETLEIQAAAIELVAMALLSSDGYDKPEAVIATKLEFLIADPDKCTRVAVAVRNLTLKLQQS